MEEELKVTLSKLEASTAKINEEMKKKIQEF